MSSPSLPQRLQIDLKSAMREKDQTRLMTVRSILAAITSKEKEGGGALTDEDYVAIVQRQAKQRRDAADQFESAGRDDLAEKERKELTLIEEYLPRQLSDDEIRTHVQAIVERTGASSQKDMGRVMGEAMKSLRGQADGNRVRQIVQELLVQ